MELDRFQVLKSYAESIRTLASADEGLAKDLSYRIIMYGIYGTEPPKKSSPIMLALFNQIKIPIDTCRAKSWNAKKNWENTLNQNGIKSKSNWNQIEIKPKEKIKYKKENNNNINVISNTKDEKNTDLQVIQWELIEVEKEKSSAKKEKEEHGNKDVNLCMKLIQKYNGGISNGSDNNQRRYARNLIRKLQKLEIVENGDFKWNEVLETVLKIISGDEYYSPKIASAQLIYNNLATLMQRCKVWISKMNSANESPLEVI